MSAAQNDKLDSSKLATGTILVSTHVEAQALILQRDVLWACLDYLSRSIQQSADQRHKSDRVEIGSAEKHGGDERVKFFPEKLTYEHLSSCPRLMLLYYSVCLTLPVKSSELFSFRWFQMVL